jgi:hypothetical protein
MRSHGGAPNMIVGTPPTVIIITVGGPNDHVGWAPPCAKSKKEKNKKEK